MGARRSRPLVLDAGALIAFERRNPKLVRLLELTIASAGMLHVPAGVVAQVWRGGARQARLARLLGSTVVTVQPLDHEEALATGVLCGESGGRDIVDTSVVLLARRLGTPVVTSDPDDLRRIDPELDVFVC